MTDRPWPDLADLKRLQPGGDEAFRVEDFLKERPGRRLKIWEVKGNVQCSIIGTCLERADVEALRRKAGVRFPPGAKDYVVHSWLVRTASQPGPIAQLINKVLERKYAPQIAQVGRLQADADFALYWEEACRKGQVAGAYWALMSHRATPDAVRVESFGDVHMLSHMIGARGRDDAKALWLAERQLATLTERLARVRRQAEETVAAKDRRIAELEQEVRAMREVCVRVRPQPVRGACALPRLERRLAAQTRRIAAQRGLLQQARGEIAQLRAELERLERLPVCAFRPAAAPPMPPNGSSVAGLQLLYVGGRKAALPHLRAGAARRRAVLLHHDGGIEQAMAQLHDLVARADLVLCPVDCVSHGACLLARDLCRRHAKPFVPLRSASLTHFRRVLGELAAAPEPEETRPCSSP
jgi:uncharacterized coiled-coil protein SlyX